jgi:hypothetical protein
MVLLVEEVPQSQLLEGDRKEAVVLLEDSVGLAIYEHYREV